MVATHSFPSLSPSRDVGPGHCSGGGLGCCGICGCISDGVGCSAVAVRIAPVVLIRGAAPVVIVVWFGRSGKGYWCRGCAGVIALNQDLDNCCLAVSRSLPGQYSGVLDSMIHGFLDSLILVMCCFMDGLMDGLIDGFGSCFAKLCLL